MPNLPSFIPALSTTRAMQLYQVMRLGSVILTSILLAKSGLSLGAIGAYEALLYLGSMAAFFWANGLLQGIPPLYARLDEATRRVFLFQVSLVFSGTGLIVVLALLLGQRWLVPALTGLEEVPHLGLFGAYLFFNLATLPVEYIYLMRERAYALVAWGMASFGLYIMVLWLPVWAGYGLEGGLWGLAVLGGLRFVWAAGLVLRYGRIRRQPRLLREYLGFSAPLVLNLLVGNLVLLFDNWLVGWYFGDEAVFAVFRYGSREFPLATALATALGTALVARLAIQPADGLAELKTKSRQLFHLLFPLTLLLLFASGPLFPRIFNPAFAASAPLFNIYLLMTASRVLLPNAIVLAMGKPRAILVVGMAELAAKVLLGLWLVHWYGLPGVAWSAVLAFWVEKAGLIWYLEKYLDVRTADWLDRRLYAGYALLLLLGYGAATWLM